MTTVFITFDGITDYIMADALVAKGPVRIAQTDGLTFELYHADTQDTADAVDAWFADLPWANETATLVAVSSDVMVTTVFVDGEPASTTRSDMDGVLIDDYLEDAA